jgi:hypothetical protein
LIKINKKLILILAGILAVCAVIFSVTRIKAQIKNPEQKFAIEFNHLSGNVVTIDKYCEDSDVHQVIYHVKYSAIGKISAALVGDSIVEQLIGDCVNKNDDTLDKFGVKETKTFKSMIKEVKSKGYTVAFTFGATSNPWKNI